jgi:RNA polymerase sigma-70 factor (ECF subfamily)
MNESTDPLQTTEAMDLTKSSSAWRAWLDGHAPKLLLFARSQTRSSEDAEDIFQDALIKLIEKIRQGEFIGGQEAWMPYLYTSIRRLAIDVGRRDDRRRRREDYSSEEVAEEQRDQSDPWFDSGASDDETRVFLEGGLKELPPKFSEVVVMKIWGDRTFAEIGESLGISQNTAASRYRYGLDALRKKLSTARRKGDLSI